MSTFLTCNSNGATNMSPPLAADDAVDRHDMQTEFFGQCILRYFSRGVAHANFNYSWAIDFSLPIQDAFCTCFAAFGIAIRVVLGNRPKKKVVDIGASGGIACMADCGAAGNWPIYKLPNGAMRINVSGAERESPITSPLRASPKTASSLVRRSQKSLKPFKICWHAAWFTAALISMQFPALAQEYPIIGGGILKPAVAYQGPLDVVSGATAWYGLRAASASYAASLGNAINVRRASDNSTQNIAVTSSGALNIASANTFAGTDATASCTFATTTATCTGASSTPHVGSTITGSGVTEPCYVTAVGTFTGGAGTLTVSGNNSLSAPCGTIASAVSITLQYGLYVTEAYDQTGNNYNASQSTAADQPQLLPICWSSLPCVSPTASSIYLSISSLPGSSVPYSYTALAERTGAFTTQQYIWFRPNGSSQANNWGFYSTANEVYYTSFTVTFTASATDSVAHIFQAIGNSTPVLNVDGTKTTGSSSTTNNSGTSTIMGGIAYYGEQGLWNGVGFSSTQQTNMCHNMYVYWGTSISC